MVDSGQSDSNKWQRDMGKGRESFRGLHVCIHACWRPRELGSLALRDWPVQIKATSHALGPHVRGHSARSRGAARALLARCW